MVFPGVRLFRAPIWCPSGGVAGREHCRGGPQGAANGQDSWGFFKDAQGFGRLDAGSRAGFTSSIFLILYMYGLEKLGLVDQNWLERNLSALLLRRLVVGRRQQSESIEAALDLE